MRIEIVPNFLSPSEIDTLNAWANMGVQEQWLGHGSLPTLTAVGAGTDKRLTSRFSGNLYEYAPDVLAIAARIRAYCGVAEKPIASNGGRDGIVVSYTKDGGDIPAHKDARSFEGLAVLRCNVMTQAPDSGGILHVGGAPVELNVGDLHCYLVSEESHFVTAVSGNVPRILWMFGSEVNADDWDNRSIVLGA